VSISPPHSTSPPAGESGTIIVILLILISLISVITIGASHSLARLRTEVLALEQRHAARTNATTFSKPDGTPSPNPGLPATESPAPLESDEPAR
jgi:hypothetical protein